MTDKEQDIIAYMIERCQAVVLAELGPIDHLKAEQIARAIGALDRPVRQARAGRDYIPKNSKAAAEAAKAAALAEVRRTGNVAAATRHGVSRATLYRLLAKP